MKLEELKQEFPPMPEDMKAMVARTVAQQVGISSSKRRHTAGKTALLVLAAALALSGTALAVTNLGGFYDLFFGTEPVTGGDSVETVTVPAYDYIIRDEEKGVDIQARLPGYELTAVDEEMAEQLVGPYIQERSDSYTMDGYTVTILGYVQDEADTYRLYYSIENPDGLDNISYYDMNGYTGVGFADQDGFRVATDGSMAYADTTRSTDTKVYICVPGTLSVWQTGADLLIIPENWGTTQSGEIDLTVESDDLVPAVTAESGNYAVSLSPMGLRVAQKTPYEDNMGFGLRYAAVTLTDGTEYVVVGPDIDNTSYRCAEVDDQGRNTLEVECFNRLIDPTQVVSVTFQGDMDTDMTTIDFG
jgi:hypothetical protein